MSIWQHIASGNRSRAMSAASAASMNPGPRCTVSTCQSRSRWGADALQARTKPRPRASMLAFIEVSEAEQA